MDLLKMHKRRSRISELVYIGLNVGLALTILAVVHNSQSLWLALLVVLVSKWRVLAVRPRFWVANLIANMVDIIVGLSVVVLLLAASNSLLLAGNGLPTPGENLPAQIFITIVYIVWLLFIKPRSRRSYVAMQAAFAIFLGITALSLVSYSWDSALFVLCMWLIGYVAARHVLGSYEELHTTLYSMITGFLFAEFGWISFHWLMAYPVPGAGMVRFSQLALIVLLLCFVSERAYASYHKHGAVRKADILAPIVLTVSIMLTVYVFALFFGTDAL